jgi:hypothetical protein
MGQCAHWMQHAYGERQVLSVRTGSKHIMMMMMNDDDDDGDDDADADDEDYEDDDDDEDDDEGDDDDDDDDDDNDEWQFLSVSGRPRHHAPTGYGDLMCLFLNY